MVKTLPFGSSGTTVNSPGFGCMGLSFGLGTNLTPEEAEPVLLKAIELGCTFWDTASVYAAGMNEKMLGDFIRKHNVRDKVFIASKCGFAIFEKAGITNSAEHIKKYIDGTIERLGFAPDLYYLHRVDPNTPLEESIPALDEIRKAGKTKFIGLSECSAKTLRKANDIAKIDAVEAEYSVFETVHETDGLIEACRDLGVAFVAYSPLGHGWLVDDFPYKSPDDFAADDLRRTCEFTSINSLCGQCTNLASHSSQVPRRKLLQEQSYCRGDQEASQQEGLWYHTNCSRLGCSSRLHRHPWYH
jgi:aryl-alcohol dehydrogenase-like predicted oxidoreductase